MFQKYGVKIFELALPWLKTHGVKIVAIVFVAWVLHKLLHRIMENVVRRLVVPDENMTREAEIKREDTLIRIFHGTFSIVLTVITALLILPEFGLDVGPFLAAAGIAGLAIGFGGQYLIRDVISGLFITLENQYRIGDVACLDDTCGLVEDISLRATILRDLDGTVHHIQHGNIGKTSNFSKVFSRVNLNVGVSYSSNLEKVIEVVNKVGNDMANDPVLKDMIIKPPQFLRVDNFGDSSIDIKILGETKPLKQWEVTGELRKRLKIAFDKEDIEIPFPQRVIYQKKS